MTDATVSGSHRGGFGEVGGETRGQLIERTFRERIVLVGVVSNGSTEAVDESLNELALLVDTAGADAVARVIQRRDTIDPATFVGKGKLLEIKTLADEVDCDTVVFDDELTPAQQRNLERTLGRTAIDRTALILDIFAQNASSREGKAQVHLAQLRYRLPRLRGRGRKFSQQEGGIGQRGPGETKLEVDRRRLLQQTHRLEDELESIRRHRATQRKARRRSPLAKAGIVGYTNAGKSTLLNRLTESDVLVENRLFATLDATTRRLELPGGEGVLLTDTVGFIRKLPHQLVEAFRSTLDVLVEADVLIHLVDGSAADPMGDVEAVRTVLDEIGAGSIPELLVVNKRDLDPVAADRLVARWSGAVAVSGVTGEGIEDLLLALSVRLRAATVVVDLDVPYARGDVMAAVHREGEVLEERPETEALRLRARLDDAARARFAQWIRS